MLPKRRQRLPLAEGTPVQVIYRLITINGAPLVKIKTMPLERAFEAYQKMKSGDIEFRMVLTMKGTSDVRCRRHSDDIAPT